MRSNMIAAVLSFSLGAHSAFAQDDTWQKRSKAGTEALSQGRLGDAAHYLEGSLREMEKAGIRDSRLADSLSTLALVYQLQKKYVKAEGLYERAFEVYKSGDDWERKMALPLWNLGKLYAAAGQGEKAEATLSQAMALAEKSKGPESLLAAGILDSLAEVYMKRQAYDEAEAAYRRALPIYEKSLGTDHWTVADTLEGYAALLRKMNRKPEAEAAEGRAKKIRSSGKRPEPYKIP